jgi:uncharacterized membrane protein
MSRTRFSTREIATAGVIAALYAVMSYFAAIFGVAYGPIQCRFSEALCVLPFFFPEAVPGLFIGCLAANLLSPYGALDIVFGSLATLLAAMWTRRVPNRFLAPLPPVICNALIVGFLLAFEQTGFTGAFLPAFLYNGATVGLGELLVCYVLGGMLLTALPKISALQPYLSPAARH